MTHSPKTEYQGARKNWFLPALAVTTLLLFTPRIPAQEGGNVFTFLFPGLTDAPPRFVFTAMTEFTDAGRKRGPASPQNPAYYITHSLGYQSRGDPIRETEATQDDIDSVLIEALGTTGLRKAGPGDRPQLAIIYMWGAHNPLDRDPDGPWLLNGMDRAALVGGARWSNRLGRAVSDTIDMMETVSPRCGSSWGGQRGLSGMFKVMNPVRLFSYDAKNEQLLHQVSGRCYFVVASAYDYDLLAKNQRQLLWRTRLTVAANGVSQKQSLPSLIAYSARFFGRDMTEPEIARLPAVPIGVVKMGTPEVVK